MAVMQIFSPIKEISEQQQPRKDEQKRGGDFYQNTMSLLISFSSWSIWWNFPDWEFGPLWQDALPFSETWAFSQARKNLIFQYSFSAAQKTSLHKDISGWKQVITIYTVTKNPTHYTAFVSF